MGYLGSVFLTGHRRGLRQGDPLSPMLFILVMDVLGHMVAKAAADVLLQPLSSRALQHRISLYADDVVLFLRPEATDIAVIMNILQLFGDASGLKTNLQKAMCYQSGVGIQNWPWYRNFSPVRSWIFPANIWGCLSLSRS